MKCWVIDSFRRRPISAIVSRCTSLADALPLRQVAHRAGEERAVGTDRQGRLRVDLEDLVADFPVDREVVLAAEPVVVDPGDVRDGWLSILGGSRRSVSMPLRKNLPGIGAPLSRPAVLRRCAIGTA